MRRAQRGRLRTSAARPSLAVESHRGRQHRGQRIEAGSIDAGSIEAGSIEAGSIERGVIRGRTLRFEAWCAIERGAIRGRTASANVAPAATSHSWSIIGCLGSTTNSRMQASGTTPQQHLACLWPSARVDCRTAQYPAEAQMLRGCPRCHHWHSVGPAGMQREWPGHLAVRH